MLASLDQLAYSVSTQVNTQNNAGTDLNGEHTANPVNIFSQPTEVAGSAAHDERGDDGSEPDCGCRRGEGTGDNSNAMAMANLANQAIVNGQTPIDYYSNFVSTLGSTVSRCRRRTRRRMPR